jgi:hypothetical protein
MVAIGTDVILPSAHRQPKSAFLERLFSRESKFSCG